METSIVDGHQMQDGNRSSTEIELLREEYQQLTEEFTKANEERAQAAKYGLHVLEEKQALQSKYVELNSLYEDTKLELDKSVETLRHMQMDYEKRIRDVEKQRGQLLEEMDNREGELLRRVDGLEDDKRVLERNLKKSVSERDHYNELNTILSSENDRLKREMDYQKEEMQSRRRSELNAQGELTYFKKEAERLQSDMEKLIWYKQEYTSLTHANDSLKLDISGLQEKIETVLCEKVNLENHHEEVVRALNSEREARSELTQQLRDEALRSPSQLAWAEESAEHLVEGLSTKFGSPGSTNNHVAHSTPFTTAKSAAPSLLSELQSSLISSGNTSELDTAQEKLREAEEEIKNLRLQKAQLEKELRSQSTDFEHQTESHKRLLQEKEGDIDGKKEELTAKIEEIGQLKSKMSAVMGEKATMEIELEGLKDELKREKAAGKAKIKKYNKEVQEDQKRIEEMQKQASQLEEKLFVSTSQCEKLEIVLANSSEGLVTMRDEVRSLLGMVLSLNQDECIGVNGKTSSQVTENGAETAVHETYTIAVQGGKRVIDVHVESHTLLSALQVWDQLRLLRGPLEHFTRSILQQSLAVSTRHISTSTDKMGEDVDNQRVSELEAEIKKLKSKLTTRTEEANQLRTIMKARQTTVDVTISSLKSKLEGQLRAHEAEANQLKHKIKTLRKERDDQTSLGAMTSRRCQEQFEEIGRIKKKIEELRGENEQLKVENKLSSMYLERAIRQKLEISVLLEQYHEEEERTRLIPMALTASRV